MKVLRPGEWDSQGVCDVFVGSYCPLEIGIMLSYIVRGRKEYDDIHW